LCFAEWFEINPLNDFENIALKQTSQGIAASDINQFNSSFFHGAFKKYSAEIEGEQYILKVAQNEYPELPKVEWVSNQIASILGLKVPEYYLINLNNTQMTFVTKNFMSKRQGANLVHIYHYLKDGDEYSCQTILNILKEKCGRLSDIKEFIFMCLFDALIGNHDRHGRNIGLVQNGPSSYSLSPTYDNPSYIGIEDEYLLGADLNPKGKIWTSKSKEATLRDYIDEFNGLEYEEITQDFIKKIKIKKNEIYLAIDKSDISELRKRAFKKIIEKRFQEVSNE
jgi:hypothetical protein